MPAIVMLQGPVRIVCFAHSVIADLLCCTKKENCWLTEVERRGDFLVRNGRITRQDLKLLKY